MPEVNVQRGGTQVRSSGNLVAFDMIPATASPSEYLPGYYMLYVETGGTVEFDVTTPGGTTIRRTVTVPDFFVTPFVVNNIRGGSAAGIHLMDTL